MEAYATLLTSDSFLMGVQCLYASLSRFTSKPLVVLATPQVSEGVRKRIEDAGMDVIVVEPIAAPWTTAVEAWRNCAATKLHIWNLTKFTKIVYLDSDCLVTAPIDELFDRPSPSFCPDVFPPDKFNAGVIVLEPDAKTYARIIEALPTLISYDGGDTGFLNAFYPDWYAWSSEHRLPFCYNALRTMYWFTRKNPGYWDTVKPKVIHYCSSPKPWEENGGTAKGELEMLWWQTYVMSFGFGS
eukprot:GEMP01042637.1.p1 GENE.GEMP01042637.1~~GEMP01042637.1.p1  ORF type:complete len:242 (+),score=52.29 GEMP01042637.1:190-915(+)